MKKIVSTNHRKLTSIHCPVYIHSHLHVKQVACCSRIENNPNPWKRHGKTKLLGQMFFMGQVMKATQGIGKGESDELVLMVNELLRNQAGGGMRRYSTFGVVTNRRADRVLKGMQDNRQNYA